MKETSGLVTIIIPVEVAEAARAIAAAQGIPYKVEIPEHGGRTSRLFAAPAWFSATVHGLMRMYESGQVRALAYHLALLKVLDYVDMEVVDSAWRLGGDQAAFAFMTEFLRESPEIRAILRGH